MSVAGAAGAPGAPGGTVGAAGNVVGAVGGAPGAPGAAGGARGCLTGTPGDDELNGSPADECIDGGGGDDVYVFRYVRGRAGPDGDGHDTILGFDEGDVLLLRGVGATEVSVTALEDGSGLLVRYGGLGGQDPDGGSVVLHGVHALPPDALVLG